MSLLSGAIQKVYRTEPALIEGSVAALRGLTLLVDDLPAVVGSLVSLRSTAGLMHGEVVGFDGRRAIVMMLGHTTGIRVGDRVVTQQSSPTVEVSHHLLGRVIDALGRPIDEKPSVRESTSCMLTPPPIGAMQRSRIRDPLRTGVRAIDLMTTVGRGQRMGIFAGPGVGKSTLLSMIACNTEAEVAVIALIGERGREVREFIEDALGPEGLARSIVVVSTSDESPLMRVRAAMTACAAAEYFRDQGRHVVLMLDSVTRLAHAQRQIGLAVGEPPATKGYTPSVFSLLPSILERAGVVDASESRAAGSITGFYTILVEGDDMTEPVSDAVRGILDGHIVLSRKLAQHAHFPAIDVLDSISRVANQICDHTHNDARRTIMQLLAAYRDAEDLIQIGAYAAGSSPVTDAAIALKPKIDAVLKQFVGEPAPFDASLRAFTEIAAEAAARLQIPNARGQARRTA